MKYLFTACQIAILTGPLLATEPACKGADGPHSPQGETAPTTQPATTSAPAADPASLKILQALEDAGKKYSTIKSDIDYEVLDRMTATTERRSGWIAFLNQTDDRAGKFRVHFETLSANGRRKTRSRVDYAFDGQWLSVAKHKIKQIIRFQVVPKGRRAKPMELGKGPFPLPFGQKVAGVVRHFEIATRPPVASDPKNTDYLKLLTRRRFRKEISFRRMEMWIDRKTHLPARIRSLDNNRKLITVTFSKTRTDEKLESSVFEIPRPIGWTERIEKLKKQ